MDRFSIHNLQVFHHVKFAFLVGAFPKLCYAARDANNERLWVLPQDRRVEAGQICFLANTMEIKHAFYPVEVGLLYHFFEFFFKSSIFVTSAAFEYDWNFTPALLVLLLFRKNARSTPILYQRNMDCLAY